MDIGDEYLVGWVAHGLATYKMRKVAGISTHKVPRVTFEGITMEFVDGKDGSLINIPMKNVRAVMEAVPATAETCARWVHAQLVEASRDTIIVAAEYLGNRFRKINGDEAIELATRLRKAIPEAFEEEIK